MAIVHVQIDRGLKQDLDKMTKMLGMSLSSFVRMAVREKIEDEKAAKIVRDRRRKARLESKWQVAERVDAS